MITTERDKVDSSLDVDVALLVGWARIVSRRGGYHDAWYSITRDMPSGVCCPSFRSVAEARSYISHQAPKYSSDMGAALSLLAQCAEKLDNPDGYNPGIKISVSGGKWFIHAGGDSVAEGPALPVVIAKLAKQIYQ